MPKLSLKDLPLKGQRVLMRVDFNVPLDNQRRVTDPTRIEATLPSLQYVLDQGGSLILMSHLGRPPHAPTPALSLAPCIPILSDLLRRPVKMAPDCVGEAVETLAQNLAPGEVLLLENLRFHRAEEFPEEDPSFAERLARLGTCYVNDAFGTAHRAHSSTATIARLFPGKAAAGLLMEKEIHFLGELLEKPNRPFYALIGGAKISTKIEVLNSLVEKVDGLLIGGGMAFTFLAAQGLSVGDSLLEEAFIPMAQEILERAAARKIPILLPRDAVTAEECDEEAPCTLHPLDKGIPKGMQGLDIGPKTISAFKDFLKNAHTLLWNGPMGVYELAPFAKGTQALAHAVASLSATTVVGGGDSIAALQEAGVADKVTHLSTGGGATLEYLEKGHLPGIDALSEARPINTR